MNIRFRIQAWTKAIVFQLQTMDATFWAKTATVIPGGFYTASNGVKVIKSTSTTDISRLVSNNEVTITSNTVGFIVAMLATADDTIRDTNMKKLVAALKEFVIYINNNGTYPHTCINCFNIIRDGKRYCKWVEEVRENWNYVTDTCGHFNLIYDSDAIYEIYEL